MAKFILKYCDKLGLGKESEVVDNYNGSISIEVPRDQSEHFLWLAGAHTVQRVPPTESKGRRHTSVIGISVTTIKAVSTAIPERDIDISTMRGTGPGGQAVNKTESTVRAVHKPTGISVRINGPDQHGNKQKAIEILSSRVADLVKGQAAGELYSQKREQIGLNNRGGKSFTWSYIDGFIKNHTTGKTTHNMKEVERGNFDLLR